MAPHDDDNVSPELLEQLKGLSDVLELYDEGQDVALDLHAAPFAPTTRERCLAFFDSPRYHQALAALDNAKGDQ